MAIGNAKKLRLSRLLSEYDWKRHPVTRTLVEKGPLGLIDLRECESFDFHEQEYMDKCHLCCDLRKIMQKAYPEMYIQAIVPDAGPIDDVTPNVHVQSPSHNCLVFSRYGMIYQILDWRFDV